MTGTETSPFDVLPERKGSVGTVLVQTVSDGDRRQLKNWLEEQADYEVAPADIHCGESDCCIMDWQTLLDNQETLRERKHESQIPLPVVLLVPDQRAEAIFRALQTEYQELEPLVDELLGMPLSQFELRQRLDSVLRARTQAAQLHAKHEQLYTILDQHPGHGVMITDTAGTIKYVNQGFEHHSGYTAEEVLGENPRILNSGVHDESFFEELWETVLSGDIWTGELTNERKDGTRYIVDQAIAPLTGPNGDVQRLVAISHEITDLRELADKLEEQRTQLDLLNRVLRHDIRNDMHVVLAWTEFVEPHVDNEGEAMLEKVMTAGEHVVELTDVAKTIVEGIFGDSEPSLEPVEVEPLLRHVIETRRETFEHATISVDGDLPDAFVNANEMLSAVFRNLINNAIQHNDSDEPTVSLKAEERDGSVRIQIADNGPGIPSERREDLFDSDVKGLDSEGTGMGLYLVDKLTEMYDGSVRIEANEPRGSVFIVAFPTIERNAGDQ
ncbi:ATP-binding protein [Halorhabdus salina]|uniref:ATP-binding protein n=1 Tax=Halorhabdus salina TaxID=2750670 RepID=UPI0015EF1A46|nr:ATP-binding protein [Halorhabdus salina]